MEVPAVVDLSARLVPLTIRHAGLDLSWSVLAVVEDWTTPSYHDHVGTPLETKRFRVRVTGPLPAGRPRLASSGCSSGGTATAQAGGYARSRTIPIGRVPVRKANIRDARDSA